MGRPDLIVAALAVASLTAQSSSRPSFDAVSIKPSASSSGQWVRPVGDWVRPVGDRVVATDATLRALIQFAYRTADGRSFLSSQIIDAPRWAETDRFDVDAKAGAAGSEVALRQLQLMTRVMLEDRFQLRTHRETRELPVYDFVVAKGGMKMKPASDSTSQDPSAPPRGQFKMIGRPSPSGAITVIITGLAVPMPQFVALLQQYLDRPIVNSTGAAGPYDVRLEFGLTQTQPATSDEPVGASIFTAVQEQLGLKLDAVKRQAEVLVIEHAEHPTPD
jgi:uncharacterized protein (TIGR03435 family)